MRLADSDLLLCTIKFCSVVFCVTFRLLVTNTSLSVFREQQTMPLTSYKCHQLATVRRSVVCSTWRSDHWQHAMKADMYKFMHSIWHFIRWECTRRLHCLEQNVLHAGRLDSAVAVSRGHLSQAGSPRDRPWRSSGLNSSLKKVGRSRHRHRRNEGVRPYRPQPYRPQNIWRVYLASSCRYFSVSCSPYLEFERETVH